MQHPGLAAHAAALQGLRSAVRRYSPAEQEAIAAAKTAINALSLAIAAYQEADFGSEVTQPLRDALDLAAHSVEAAQS